MLAFNTSTSESTGYSPAFLIQRSNPRLPKALYDLCDDRIRSSVCKKGRTSGCTEDFQNCTPQLRKGLTNQCHHYNLRHRKWIPKIGDHVLVRQHPLSKAVDNFNAKLALKFKGPYVVTEFTSPVIVLIKTIGTNDQHTAHISELKPYYSNNSNRQGINSADEQFS